MATKKKGNVDVCMFASRRTLHGEDRWDVIDTSAGCRKEECVHCGWNPEEKKRRVGMIRRDEWSTKAMVIMDAAGVVVDTVPVKYLDVGRCV